MKLKPWALITGATAGIGLATAEILARNHYNVVITGRRQERLKEIARDFEKKYSAEVLPLTFDVSSRSETEETFKSHAANLTKVSVLVNNAGLAMGTAKFDELDIEDFEIMMNTNVKGLVYMTRFLLPSLKQQVSPHIVNIGSVAGRWIYPGGAIYCATKFAVRAISEGLRMDLIGSPVRVTNIEPGMVATEFSEVRLKSKEKSKKVYQGMTPLSAQDIAESVLWCLSRPAHVNIQELVIFPTDQPAVGQVNRKDG